MLTDRFKIAVRKLAAELLATALRDRAKVIKDQLPPFVVCNNARVTAMDLTTIADNVTACPQCSKVFAGNIDTPSGGIPDYVLVDVCIRVPTKLVPSNIRADAVQDSRSIDVSDIAKMLQI